MHPHVTSDVEVKTMTSGKERQRKYIEKMREEGKKSVTVLISQVTKGILDTEREKTGETLSSIIERAVMNLEKFVTSDEIKVADVPDTTTSDTPKKKQKTPRQKNLELF
jgi:hypothetical protein